MGNPLKITESIVIDDETVQIKAMTSSGPGGQHVNKNMTAIQLRFDIINCATLSHDVQQRLIHLGGSRVNNDYQLVITARRHRSQERNKREALDRLCMLIRKAADVRKPRVKKRRTYAEHQDRLEHKHRRSETKILRRRVDVSYD